jgi:hypothetical protein
VLTATSFAKISLVAVPRILTAAQTASERQAQDRLAELLQRHELDRVVYTGHVLIDETAPIAHSHPILTLLPEHAVAADEDVVLTTFVHEQMHWAANVLDGVPAAKEDVRRRWPTPPDVADGGATDARSTWLHLVVCALEIAAMAHLVGTDRAVAAVRSVPWYRWIYERLLGDDLPWQASLERWQIDLPPAPPAGPDRSSWVHAAAPDQLRAVVGTLAAPFTGFGLEEDLLLRIIASCCLRLDDHPEAAERLDPRNADDVYPVLRERVAEVREAAARLRRIEASLT